MSFENEIIRLNNRIKSLEKENQLLKAELEELRNIFELETERSYLYAEQKTGRLLKKNKIAHRKNRKLNKELVQAKENTIQTIAKKAAQSRHAPIKARKEQAIQEYKNSGLSKNEFAAKFAEKYHVAESTMRKNWLQGV